MNEHVRIAPPQNGASFGFSSADFARMQQLGAFEDMRVELVGGRLEKMAPAYGGHGRQNANIVHLLIMSFEGTGFDIATDLAVIIDDSTTRGIDIAVGSPGFPEGQAASGQDILLAVEIADTTLARDLGSKATDYAAAGIAHYWVVDLASRVVHVMQEPTENGYSARNVVRFDEPLAVPETDRTITIA
jgi:Uma2 family endonuclease